MLTPASLSFPSYPTLSLSIPLSLVGFSSLVISSFSSLHYFQTPPPESDLDAVKFVTFLGILSPVINLFSAVFMRVISPAHSPSAREERQHDVEEGADESDAESDMDSEAERYMTMSQSLHLDERTPLIIGGIEAAWEDVEEMERGKDVTWTVGAYLKDFSGFWMLGIILALSIGPVSRFTPVNLLAQVH